MYKSKGVNAKTLHLVQLLLAGTLQGCAYESYEDTSVFLELVGTVYEEHPRYFVFFLTALALLVTAFLGYLNGVQWRMSIQIGRGPTSGLEPGYGMSGPARSNERNVKTDNSQNEHHEPDTADPDTENSQDEHTAGRTGTPARSRHAARPRSGRPDEPVDVATNLKRIVRYAPNWGYGYPVATCSSFRRAARYFEDHSPDGLGEGTFPLRAVLQTRPSRTSTRSTSSTSPGESAGSPAPEVSSRAEGAC